MTLQTAALDKSVGLVTAAFLKEPGDPTWKDDPEVAEYVAFLKKYSPEADPNDWPTSSPTTMPRRSCIS